MNDVKFALCQLRDRGDHVYSSSRIVIVDSTLSARRSACLSASFEYPWHFAVSHL